WRSQKGAFLQLSCCEPAQLSVVARMGEIGREFLRVPSTKAPPRSPRGGGFVLFLRGSPKRPTRPGWGRRAGTLHDAHGGRGRVMTKREATLNERTRMYSRHTQRSAAPLRSPSFGAVQCLELLRRKQAHWRARPPTLRNTQSRSQRRQRQTVWPCA